MSGLPERSPHHVSRTVIRGRVLSLQVVHLQIQRVLGVVSGDGESALHGVCVACATSTTTNFCDPLQPLPWSLADPAHPIATEGESRGYTGESQGPSGFTRSPPDSTSCMSHWTPTDTRHLGQETVTHPLVLTHIHSHTQCLPFTMHYLSDEQPGKPSPEQTPW